MNMNINRINYEEYFLLYVDNELSASERKAVEEFVKLHPDLEEELTMLQQSQLKPDHSLVLEDKSVLFKSERNNLINVQNYESFFLLYVDNELSVEERRTVEDFVTANPQLHEEFELLLRTRVSPDVEVVYPDRQLLYREVATGKVVSFKMWRTVAVAAMLLLVAGVFWLNSGSNKNSTIDPLAKRDVPTKLKPNSQETKEQVPTAKDVQKEQSNPNVADAGTKTQEESIRTATQKVQQKKVDKIAEENDQHPLIADNNIPTPLRDPIEHIPASTSISKVDIDVVTIGSASVSNNTLIVDQAFAEPKADNGIQLTTIEDGGISDEQPAQSKSKLRGLFRQVSRVVEKTTHVPAAENKKLRIGNIQIALK